EAFSRVRRSELGQAGMEWTQDKSENVLLRWALFQLYDRVRNVKPHHNRSGLIRIRHYRLYLADDRSFLILMTRKIERFFELGVFKRQDCSASFVCCGSV